MSNFARPIKSPPMYALVLRENVRRRVYFVIQQWADDVHNHTSLDEILEEIGKQLLVLYGGLDISMYEAANVAHHPVLSHFFLTRDDRVLQFIEIAFTTRGGLGKQKTVDAINELFRSENIGYELTPYIETFSEAAGKGWGTRPPREVHTQYPKFIARDSDYLHIEAMQPAIDLLTDSRFSGANAEFMLAHQYYRQSDFAACLSECLKAFESTMKIICHHRNWPYSQSDTASKLVSICFDNQLLPGYNQQHLTSLRTLLESTIPTQRNKNSGHGRGVQQIAVTENMARFALHSTAATILFLVGESGI